jgi:AraC-like DNA-binding protein
VDYSAMPIIETYDVVSNPYEADEDIHILFTGLSQTRPGHQVGPKVFDYYLIHHVLAGQGTFITGDRQYELTKGDSFIIEPGHLYEYRANHTNPWQYNWIAVKGSKFPALLSQAGITLSSPIVHPVHPQHMEWIDQIRSAFRSKDSGGGLRANGYLILVLSNFQHVKQPGQINELESLTTIERHVKEVAQLLTTRYTEPISIENIAKLYGYNRAYFSKMFKVYNHVAPVTFLLNLRVSKARQLLRERSELTIEQIAYSVGFNDPLYFSKQFKKFYQLSPSEYRRSLSDLLTR